MALFSQFVPFALILVSFLTSNFVAVEGGCFIPTYKCADAADDVITAASVCSPQCTEKGVCKTSAGTTFEITSAYKLHKNLTSINFVAYAYPEGLEEYRFLVSYGDFCTQSMGNPTTNISCPVTADSTNSLSFSYVIPRLAGFRPGNYTFEMDARAVYDLPNGQCSKPTCIIKVKQNVCVNCVRLAVESIFDKIGGAKENLGGNLKEEQMMTNLDQSMPTFF